jgi:hypothetical protein
MAIPARQRRITGRFGLVDGIGYKMPIDSWEASSIIAAFPCDYDAAKALLPPGDVHPFRLWKRALLIVTVIDYRQTDIGSYIEYSMAIACTKGAKPASRLLPAIFMKWFGTGQYVVDLPVSTEVSTKGGKGIWGMPKHRESLDYVEGQAWISAQYDKDGEMATRFDVRRPRKIGFPLGMAAINYCMFRGMIYRSYIYFKGKAGLWLRKRGAARFLIGDHPSVAHLKTLNADTDPLFAAYMPAITGVLDDYLESWFVTWPKAPAAQVGEGLETTYPLGYGQDRPPPPVRDPAFDPDKE